MIRRFARYLILALVFALLSGHGAGQLLAQGPPVPVDTRAAVQARPRIPLKVTVVISRFQGQGEKGDKRTGSLPFMLHVNTFGGGTNLAMESQVAVPVSVMTPATKPSSDTMTSFQYRSLGTIINCTAEVGENGRYLLNLTVQDSQIFGTDSSGAKIPAPSFQQFNSTTTLSLRDGETIQYTTATDKTTGEVIKVDVTLNVVK